MDKIENLKKYIELNEKELRMLELNFYDSFAFNEYLFKKYYREDLKYNIFTEENLNKFFNYFKRNGLDKETQKNIILSSPMILLIDNIENINFIHNDKNLEGFSIRDDDYIQHFYKYYSDARSSISEVPPIIDKDKPRKLYQNRFKEYNDLSLEELIIESEKLSEEIKKLEEEYRAAESYEKTDIGNDLIDLKAKYEYVEYLISERSPKRSR